ncbi:MAG TPA: sterol desaturase family protein [Lacibacter sp.]|nr:sterol desaturase family protein [Lacibacter sp.]HMO87756.1 sterol desaturase family protein [Lacibacter sp.]HMP85684.1 sterol desaturase family protein [Lacibacter sp.]
MILNWLATAVPFFILLMLLEFYVSKRKGKQVFSFEESVANLNVGIAERLCDVFTTGLFFYFFDWIYQNAALFHFKPMWYHWIFLFLFTDFLWYWYHRFGHEVNLFWSAHVVHHQSTDYNYTVSARITVVQAVFRCLFWSILPLLGFPAYLITALLLVHGTYPFFTHTQLIGKLGWIEYIFVTPSHHRVHHSSNPKYLDKNYGDVLIIWDKIFGTFVEEDEQPVYGLTKPLKNYSFLWQHFHFTLEMGIAFFRASGVKNKLKAIFGRPDDIDPRIRTVLERKLINRNAHGIKRPMPIAIAIQTVITLTLLFFIILFEHYLGGLQLMLCALFIFISVINTGAMLEHKDWVFYLEYARLIILYIFITTWHFHPFVNICLLLTLTILGFYFRSLNTYYKTVLYQVRYERNEWVH